MDISGVTRLTKRATIKTETITVSKQKEEGEVGGVGGDEWKCSWFGWVLVGELDGKKGARPKIKQNRLRSVKRRGNDNNNNRMQSSLPDNYSTTTHGICPLKLFSLSQPSSFPLSI